MTISSTSNKAQFSGSGTTGPFPFSYKVFDQTDLTVIKTNPSAVDSTLVITTDYTVSLNADQNNNPGGSVTTVAAVASGYTLTVLRDVDATQATDVANGGGFYPEVIEDALDKLTMLAQQNAEKLDRAVLSGVSGTNPTPQELLDSINAAADSTAADAASAYSSASAAASSASAASSSASDAANSAASAASQNQTQLATRFTAGGTADAITGTLSPAITGYTAGLRVTTTPGGANTVTGPTLNLNSLGTKTIKKRDSGGSKVALVAGDYNASGPFNLEYDGTDFILLDPLTAAAVSSSSVPVRQTVLSGPVDSSGFSSFGGSTGSTTVTASGALKATACAGGDANYTGSIVNPSWTGLSTNGTMYLYLDITSGGVVTTGSTTLEPTYQWGGAYSTTNNQNTYNIQECTMKVGNGSTASQVYRVFVGEVTVAGGVTTAITWYQLQGRYNSALQAVPSASSSTSFNHNLGCDSRFVEATLKARINASFNGFSAGAIFKPLSTYNAAAAQWNGEIDTIVVKSRTNLSVEIIGGLYMQNGTIITVGSSVAEIFVEARRTW